MSRFTVLYLTGCAKSPTWLTSGSRGSVPHSGHESCRLFRASGDVVRFVSRLHWCPARAFPHPCRHREWPTPKNVVDKTRAPLLPSPIRPEDHFGRCRYVATEREREGRDTWASGRQGGRELKLHRQLPRTPASSIDEYLVLGFDFSFMLVLFFYSVFGCCMLGSSFLVGMSAGTAR